MSAACSSRSGVDLARAQEGFDIGEALRAPARCRRSASRTSSNASAGGIELDQRREADERDHQRAAMADFLEAAAIAGQRVAFDGDQDFAGRRARSCPGPVTKSASVHARVARSCRRAALASSTSASCAISGGVPSAAGEALTILPPMVADSRIWSSANHTAQRGMQGSARASAGSSRKRWIGVAAPKPHALARRRVRSRSSGMLRHVDQHRNIARRRRGLRAPTAAYRSRPRQCDSGRDCVSIAVERLVERSRRQIFVAEEHCRCLPFLIRFSRMRVSPSHRSAAAGGVAAECRLTRR